MIETAGTVGEKFAAIMVATVGTALAAQAPEVSVPFVWGVLKLYVVAVGFFGALVSLSFLRPRDLWIVWSCILSGTGCAGVLTPLLTKLWIRWIGDIGMTAESETALAFALGVGGFALIPGGLFVLERFKSNPWGVIDWIRGRGAPPAAPPGGSV